MIHTVGKNDFLTLLFVCCCSSCYKLSLCVSLENFHVYRTLLCENSFLTHVLSPGQQERMICLLWILTALFDMSSVKSWPPSSPIDILSAANPSGGSWNILHPDKWHLKCFDILQNKSPTSKIHRLNFLVFSEFLIWSFRKNRETKTKNASLLQTTILSVSRSRSPRYGQLVLPVPTIDSKETEGGCREEAIGTGGCSCCRWRNKWSGSKIFGAISKR